MVTPSLTTPDGTCFRCGNELDEERDGDIWCEPCHDWMSSRSLTINADGEWETQ